MDLESIVAAHVTTNSLPKVHPVQRLRSPEGRRADVDELLVPLVQALWAAGVPTVAGCQNVREFVTCAAAERMQRILAEVGPLTHATSALHGHGYLRLIDDGPAARKFLRAAGPRLTRCGRLDILVQIEFDPADLPALVEAVSADE